MGTGTSLGAVDIGNWRGLPGGAASCLSPAAFPPPLIGDRHKGRRLIGDLIGDKHKRRAQAPTTE